nr:MAG TPA: YebO-like protein [Caudoviricetes sp.]
MIFVKLMILLWVIFLIIRFFVRANLSLLEETLIALGKLPKLTFGLALFLISFCLAFIDSFVALIWFLFFR